jgi:glycosyltransferase involved in cell wall biosynthesis
VADLSIVAIIPLYNGAKWVEQSIRSVLSQTLQPDEFIVVDDGSTDGGAGAAIVERLANGHPIITLLRKQNGGQSSARNFGVRQSKSALIALLDQDDFWYPDHLEELRMPFEKDRVGRMGWVYSDLDRIDEAGNMFCHQFLSTLPNQHPKQHIYKCLQEDMFILPSASLISRKAFEAIGGFDERLCGYEDDDLFLRLFRAGWKHVFLEESLSAWRIYPASTSYTMRMLKSRSLYFDKLMASFRDEERTDSYPVRDFIAPRVVKTLLVDTYLASRGPDWLRVRQNVLDLHTAAASLRPIQRTMARGAALILRIPFLVRPAMFIAFAARRVMKLIPRTA